VGAYYQYNIDTVFKMNDQLILEDNNDENYVPPEDEIHKYAQLIGIDPDLEPHLLWIAREGINAPLPENWKKWYDCIIVIKIINMICTVTFIKYCAAVS
jgi:hypothetical protein